VIEVEMLILCGAIVAGGLIEGLVRALSEEAP
jgi:hypothetical protein